MCLAHNLLWLSSTASQSTSHSPLIACSLQRQHQFNTHFLCAVLCSCLLPWSSPTPYQAGSQALVGLYHAKQVSSQVSFLSVTCVCSLFSRSGVVLSSFVRSRFSSYNLVVLAGGPVWEGNLAVNCGLTPLVAYAQIT
jgi:hypothetical protein